MLRLHRDDTCYQYRGLHQWSACCFGMHFHAYSDDSCLQPQACTDLLRPLQRSKTSAEGCKHHARAIPCWAICDYHGYVVYVLELGALGRDWHAP